jgi:hypothetical protein
MAVNLLTSVFDAPDLVTMLVMGADERARRIVDWAGRLCGDPEGAEGPSPRRVVWVRDPELPEVKVLLALLLALPLPRLAVVRSPDTVCARLGDEDGIDPGALERAFVAGQEA